jgi:hypothetical protein
MALERLLLTIEGSFFIGAVAGIVIGFFISRPKLGCAVLLIIPTAMIFFIGWWQGQHPENLRSTSGLDFMFGPLWPSVGALAGSCLGRLLKSRIDKGR